MLTTPVPLPCLCSQDYISQGSTNNALCFQGPYRTKKANTDDYTELVPGQGHWGKQAMS